MCKVVGNSESSRWRDKEGNAHCFPDAQNGEDGALNPCSLSRRHFISNFIGEVANLLTHLLTYLLTQPCLGDASLKVAAIEKVDYKAHKGDLQQSDKVRLRNHNYLLKINLLRAFIHSSKQSRALEDRLRMKTKEAKRKAADDKQKRRG